MRSILSIRNGGLIFDVIDALESLQQEIIAWLDSKRPAKNKDKISQRLLQNAIGELECPPIYLLYRKLKLYGGQNGGIPFLWSGGYEDQPWLMSLCIEACAVAEIRYHEMLSELVDEEKDKS